jgi:hypothetical protein
MYGAVYANMPTQIRSLCDAKVKALRCAGDSAALCRAGGAMANGIGDAIIQDNLCFSFRRLNIDRTASMLSRPPGAMYIYIYIYIYKYKYI